MRTSDEAAIIAIKHYLGQTAHILQRLSKEDRSAELLEIRLAPDMFSTGFNIAVAIQFSARGVCLPAGVDVPDIPDEFDCEALLAFHSKVAALIDPIEPVSFANSVEHVAGEARLTQNTHDYIARFALPNMIFHLTLAYAALRQNGVALGKADFDGLHHYSNA